MEGVLAITFIFGGGTLFLLAISPVGKAIADRIRRPGGAALPEDVKLEMDDTRAELQEEMGRLREEVGELAERLDFAERMLAKGRESGGRLPPPA